MTAMFCLQIKVKIIACIMHGHEEIGSGFMSVINF